MKREDVKQTYSDLEKVPGHKNFYRNPLSGKIHFKRGAHKFATNTTKIGEAKAYAEIELARRLQPGSERSVRRRRAGIHNPYLADLWEGDFLEMKRTEITESTLMTYEQNWKFGMFGFWGDKTVNDVTDDNVAAFKVWSLENNPKRDSDHTVVQLQSFFRFLVARKILRSMPDMSPLKGIAEIINRNARREKVGRIYSAGEEQALIDGCDRLKEYMRARTRLGIMLGARCGMRKMEILTLKWENIDFHKGLIRVWSNKNHKWRNVPMVNEVRAAANLQLNFLRDQVPLVFESDWVFPMKSDSGRHLSSQNFDKGWKAAKKAAGIGGRARFHDLRHTFATRTAEDGWPPIVACDVLDQSLRIYQRVYCKPSQEKISEMMMRTFGGQK